MITALRALRPHQIAGIEGIRSSIAAGQTRPILEAPTGYGKTVVAAHLVAAAREAGRRIAFCVPSISLIDQTFERFRENGIDPGEMGIIQADHPWRRPSAPIQIATAQTLSRRLWPIVDEVIIDEAHIQHDAYRRWMGDPEWQHVPFVGLTATPGSRGLGKLFSHVVRPTSLAALIAEGYLAPFVVYAPSRPDLSGVREQSGDYHQGDLAERMDKPGLVADAVETWQRLAAGRPTLCFATGRRHAQSLHGQYLAAGIPAAYVDADTPRQERDRIGRQLATGEVLVAVNIGTLTTGIDWDVRCIQLCRPTKSQMLFVQMIGRGLRTAPGKADLVILDHSDNHARLGFATDIRFRLDDGAPKARAKRREAEDAVALPRCCPSCTALMLPRAATCTACGTELGTPIIRTEAGTLTPIGRDQLGEALRAIRAAGLRLRLDGDRIMVSPKGAVTPAISDLIRAHRVELIRSLTPPKSTTARLREQPQAIIHAMLLRYADETGKSTGWAAHQFRELFGQWPPRTGTRRDEEPSADLRSWLTAQRIRWAAGARRRAKQGGAHATA